MGLFSDDDDSDKCPVHNLTEQAAKTFIAGMRFQEFNKILAGACTALACLVSFYHLSNHARHLSLPRQQIKVMRVIALVPTYTIVNLLCISFPTAAVYILPLLDLITALCLASYFILICEYISPHTEGRDAFFARIEIEDKKSPDGKVADSVNWFWQRTFMIFQYPVVSLGLFIATAVTQAINVYCQFDSNTRYAKLYLSIVSAVSSGLAIAAVILVAINVKKQMPNLKPMHKLIAIKLVVGLAFIQQILFWILQAVKVLKPTDKLTYADLHIGIPSLLSCLEMVPISFIIMWAYPVTPYLLSQSTARRSERGETHEYAPTSYQGGALGIHAFLAMLNPVDIIKAIAAAFTFFARDRKSKIGSGSQNSSQYYSNAPPQQQYNGPSYNNGNFQQQPGAGYVYAPGQGPPRNSPPSPYVYGNSASRGGQRGHRNDGRRDQYGNESYPMGRR